MFVFGESKSGLIFFVCSDVVGFGFVGFMFYLILDTF